MEHLSAPLHWANVSVYSKSLKGCAFESASYWNTSHGHICLPLPWCCRQNLLDSNDHFCTPLASNSLLAKCIATGREEQHAPICVSVSRIEGGTAQRFQKFCERKNKKKITICSIPIPKGLAQWDYLFMCWSGSFIDALWMIHELIHTVNNKRWTSPSIHRKPSQIMQSPCCYPQRGVFAHKGFMKHLSRPSLSFRCWSFLKVVI